MAKKLFKTVGKIGKFALTGGLVGAGVRALDKKKKKPVTPAPATVQPLDADALDTAEYVRRRAAARAPTIVGGGAGSTLGGY